MAVQKLSKQFGGYTKQDMKNTKVARELQGMVGHSVYREYKDMVSNKLFPNFPITTHDIINENSMFGPNLAGVKGNSV